MFRRRGSSARFPHSSVIVEFHEFEGRWFVTDSWAHGSGAALRRPLTDAGLGKAVLGRIRGTRRPRHYYGANQRRDADEWGRFCVEVAGVPTIRYRPEKRLVILADQAGMRCADARHWPRRWETLPDDRPAALGAALIARIGGLEASWPTAATAEVANDGATMLIYPRPGISAAAPIVQLSARSSAAAVGSAVLYALVTSSAGAGIPAAQASEGFRAALRKAGWTMGALNAAATVSVRRTTIGEMFISGAGSSEDIPVADQGSHPVGAAVMAQFGDLAFAAPVPPGRRPASFGPKIGWIAVRGASADAVVQALGLRNVRPASWDDGIEAAYDEGVFVGPPVDGWVFAAGADILGKQVDPAALSRQLGSEVQLFRSHRVPEYHEWSRAENGVVTREARSVGESGEAHQAGEPTDAERALGLDNPDDGYSENDVFAIAGAWSLDPTTLHDHPSEGTEGTWGQLPLRVKHAPVLLDKNRSPERGRGCPYGQRVRDGVVRAAMVT
jgi:hypothetical protein